MGKKSSKVAVAGWRKKGEDGGTMHVGPTYHLIAPENAEQDEMEEALDVLMALPKEVIGSAIVLREGYQLIKIDDGPKNPLIPMDQTVTLDD